jgi:hypothetical protein
MVCIVLESLWRPSGRPADQVRTSRTYLPQMVLTRLSATAV